MEDDFDISEREKLPEAVWEGEVSIGNLRMKCFVLDNGQRIIDADSFYNLLDAMTDGSLVLQESDCTELAKWMKGVE